MKKRGLDSRRWLKHHEPVYSAPKLSLGWQRNVTEAVRAYPELCRERERRIEEEAYRWRHGRGIERGAERCLGAEQRAYDAVRNAIAECRDLPHGHTAVKLIKARYWGKRELTLREAAAAFALPLGRAKGLERMFMGRVARGLGYRHGGKV